MNLLFYKKKPSMMENYISKLLILNRLWFKVPIFFPFFFIKPTTWKTKSSLQIYKIIFEFGPSQLNLFRYITKKAGILCKEPKEKWRGINRWTTTNMRKWWNECKWMLKRCWFDVYQFERLLEGGFPMIPLFYFKYMNFIKKKYKQALNN